MGSDRKSEEKKQSRKRCSSSASEDEGKRKRHRTEEDEDRKSRKSDKDKKRSHKHSDKKKRTKDKHRSKHPPLNIEIKELSGDDYFSKNKEFSTWLKEEKDLFFSDLSAESARKLFSYFVKAWNKKKLASRYYEGIETAPRSAHNWKIKG